MFWPVGEGKDRAMRKFWLLLVLVSFNVRSAGGGTIGDSTSQAAPIISGTVTFKGSPLEGVTVTAFDVKRNAVYQVATTDADGRYSFSGMPSAGAPAEYQIWANKDGYGFYPSVGRAAKVKRADYTRLFFENPT